MKLWNTIRHLLSVLAVLGVVIAPFAASAALGGIGVPVSMAAASSDMGEQGDMPCCPPEKPVMPDCMKACPLLAVCLGKTIQGAGSAAPLPVRLGTEEALVPGDEAVLRTRTQGPPLRPPQA